MADEEVARIHERLDTIVAAIGEVKAAVRENDVACRPCRSVVMGNGHEPIDARVTRLETRADSARYFLHVGYAAAACAGGVLAALLPWIGPWIGRLFQ